jgi:hypothetical protein
MIMRRIKIIKMEGIHIKMITEIEKIGEIIAEIEDKEIIMIEIIKDVIEAEKGLDQTEKVKV